MQSLSLVLVTGRTIKQGVGLDRGKLSKEYMDSVAVVELDKEDWERLGLSEGSNAEVKTKFGSVVVKAVKSRRRHPGIAFMPMGPWASIVVNPDTQGSGMPTLKGLKAEITPTSEKVLDVRELMSRVLGVKIPEPPLASISPNGEGEKRVVKDVTCCFCGCLCDDLVVEISGCNVVKVKNACPLGASKIMHRLEFRVLKPYIREDGAFVEVSLDEAIKKAAEILVKAKYPLLYGWSNTSSEAIKLGVELAEYLGGAFDNTSVLCHGPTIQGVQEAGFVAATLGQVRNYADLIIYWGCNPLNAHPRHLARYSAMAKGIYVKGRKDRKVVVIDVRETDTAKIADLFIKVKPHRDFELVTALRALAKRLDIEAKEIAGVDGETIKKLFEIMITARFGVIFYGLGLTMTEGKGRNIEAIIRLTQELNEWTKFVAIPMRGHYNVVGANTVSAWTTGYAFSVDFRRGHPRYNPGEYSATDLLERGDVDAALVVASDPAAHFPAKSVKNLARIPVITIDPKWSLTALISRIVIPAAIAGVECGGTAYRMDKVPLHLKKLVEPPELSLDCPYKVRGSDASLKKLVDPPAGVLSDVEILEMLLKEVKRIS